MVKVKNKEDHTATKVQNVQKKKPEEVQEHLLSAIIAEYCSTTTLHGVGYIGGKNKTVIEKLWWLSVFIMSVIASYFLISKTWHKWETDPVILSFEKEQTPIWTIPFPAVTICPINKVIERKYNYTKQYLNKKNLKGSEYKEFWDISLLCNLEQYNDQPNSNENYFLTNESTIETFRKYAHSLWDIMHDLKWQNNPLDKKLITEQLTEEGVCFTFNSFGQNDMYTDKITNNTAFINHNIKNNGWNMEDGFSPTSKLTDIPLRSTKDGYASGISFSLHTNYSDIDYLCGLPISGYKIIVHNPAESPKATQQYFLVPFNRKMTIIVKPELTTTSDTLVPLSPYTRKCYFSKEKSLKFFKIYSQNNCRVECSANITKEYCGCVPFYMPREKGTPICAFGETTCVSEVEDVVLFFDMRENINQDKKKDKKLIERVRKMYESCDCLPPCTSLHFSAETSQAGIHKLKINLTAGKIETIDKEANGKLTVTEVDVFFKESQFLALHRSELFGQTDFLANCGGLLGLFMGFSILSLVEIIYFLTLRLIIVHLRRRELPTKT